MPLHSRIHPRFITSIASGLLVSFPNEPNKSNEPHESNASPTRTLPAPTNAARITKAFRRDLFKDDDAMLAAAVEWRDAAWQALYGEPVPARSFHQTARKGSMTNIPGVRYVEKKVYKKGRTYVVPCVIAEVHTVPGKDYQRPRGSRSKIFSLNKYDFDEAVALAAAWRANLTAQLLTTMDDPENSV